MKGMGRSSPIIVLTLTSYAFQIRVWTGSNAMPSKGKLLLTANSVNGCLLCAASILEHYYTRRRKRSD